MILRIALGLLGMLVLALLGTGLYFYYHGQAPRKPRTPYPIKRVAHSAIDGNRQRFNVVADAEGTLHLAWQGLAEGVNYQASRDDGTTWTRPVRLAETAPDQAFFHRHKMRPQVFVHGSEVLVWWNDMVVDERRRRVRVRRSLDGGRHWEPLSEEADDVMPSIALLRQYAVLADEATLYLAYSVRKEGLLVRRSDDFGRTWTPPVQSTGFRRQKLKGSSVYVSLARHRERLYLAWSEVHDFYITWSDDQGQSWQTPTTVPLDLSTFGRGLLVQDPESGQFVPPYKAHFTKPVTLQSTDEGLYLIFDMYGLVFCQLLDEDGAMQGPPQPVPGQIAAASRPAALRHADDTMYLVWTDRSYPELRWWARMPYLAVLALIEPGYITNNDVFMSTVIGGVPEEPQPVTRRYSLAHVLTGFEPLLVAGKAGRVYAFWSGRRKVGETPDSYGYPIEILFSRVF